MMAHPAVTEAQLVDVNAAFAPSPVTPAGNRPAPALEFSDLGEGRYQLVDPASRVRFTIDHLRREHHELLGELTVSLRVAGVPASGGALSVGTLNLSSCRARADRARVLEQRAHTAEIPWLDLLEALSQHVLRAERTGQPAVLLRDEPARTAEPEHEVLGITLPRDHPSIVFGDNATCKSLLGLYAGGLLDQRGERVGFFDWELDAGTHKERLVALFGDTLPAVYYARCEKPLIFEVERLSRIVQDAGLTYGIFDSVGVATNGPPEGAEQTTEYYRALRRLKIGSLNLAHINRSEQGDQRPFGSVFWSNLARSVWNVKVGSTSVTDTELTLGLYHRKCNVSRLRPAIGLRVTFDAGRISFDPIDIADIEDLAQGLPLWQRMKAEVAQRPQTLAALAERLPAKVDTLDRLVRRHRGLFSRVDGSDGVTRIALVSRRTT